VANASGSKLVCFFLGGQEYAARIEHMKETLTVRPISRVFLTPPWVAGVLNLRGDIVAVLDLAHMLGMAPTEITDDSRILIALYEGKRAGILVDRMGELRDVDPAGLQPPPPTLPADAAGLMLGVATVEQGAPLRVLDIAAVFESDRLREYRRA
jgi:purine-binding chemotaxis protein CheW